MAADISLAEYNSVAQALLTPFDDSEISEREGSGNKTFSYVPPERYRYRLLEVFKNGFEFEVTDAVAGKTGVQAQATFVGEVPEEGVRYVIAAPCFEPWTIGKQFLWNNDTKKYDRPNPDAGKIIAPEQTFQKLISAGLKAVSRELGLGLHLYDKAARKSGNTTTASAPATTAAPAASSAPGQVGNGAGIANFDPEWDGSEFVTIGKFKGKNVPWNSSEVEDDYLSYLTSDPEKSKYAYFGKAQKEIARRQSIAGQSGQANAAVAMAATTSSASDDDFAF